MQPYNVVYATNEGYVQLAGVSMLSLCENNRHLEQVNIYILVDDVSEDSAKKLLQIGEKYQRNVYIIDTKAALQDIESKGTAGYDNALDKGLTAYARLYIAQLLPDVERVLYLDCDTLVAGDIQQLYDMDMHDKPIALAYDTLQNGYKKVIEFPNDSPYFNSGVMLIDMAKWKEKACKERIFKHLQTVRNSYPLVDQDFINVVLNKEIAVFSMKYNYLSQYFLYGYKGTKFVYDLKPPYFWEEKQWVDDKDAVIFHFCGQTFLRPWFANSKHPKKEEYDKYYAMSPWKDCIQKEQSWALPYKVQYLLWRYMPKWLNQLGSKIMQRIFIAHTYG